MQPDPGQSTRLEQERRRKSFSQTVLAAASGLHAGVISSFERRRAIPSLHQRARLAKALGMSEAELFGDMPDRIPLIRS